MFEKSMFHRIHLIEGTTGEFYDEEEEQFVIDNNDTHHGTAELLLDEQGKKIRFNKFNKDFDVAKVLAEVMSLQSSLKMFLSSIYRLQNRTWQCSRLDCLRIF